MFLYNMLCNVLQPSKETGEKAEKIEKVDEVDAAPSTQNSFKVPQIYSTQFTFKKEDTVIYIKFRGKKRAKKL